MATTVFDASSDNELEHQYTRLDDGNEQQQCQNCEESTQETLKSREALVAANARINELEDQIMIMTVKATAAVDKLADYEDKLKRLSTGAALRALPTNPTSNTTTPDRALQHPQPQSYLSVFRHEAPPRPATADGIVTIPPIPPLPERKPTPPSKFPSFSAFWSGKKAAPEPPIVSSTPRESPVSNHAVELKESVSSTSSSRATTPPEQMVASLSRTSSRTARTRPLRRRVSIATESAFEPRSSPSPARSGTRSATPVNTHDLDAEHALRLAAEEKLAELQAELADLSTSLFEQANKMVADERRLRAKCEARMKVLEEQIVQAEERIKASAKRKEEEAEAKQERVERLRKLEERMGRVERVRKTLKGVG